MGRGCPAIGCSGDPATPEAGHLVLCPYSDHSKKPCKGKNINVCIAEGCFGQACVKEKRK